MYQSVNTEIQIEEIHLEESEPDNTNNFLSFLETELHYDLLIGVVITYAVMFMPDAQISLCFPSFDLPYDSSHVILALS